MADSIDINHTEEITKERTVELLDFLKTEANNIVTRLKQMEDYANDMCQVINGEPVMCEIHLQSKEAMSQYVGYLEGKFMESFQNMDKVLLEIASHGPVKED